MPAAAKKDGHGRVEALDLLRLLAAMAVVLYHYSFRGAAADGFTNLSLPAIIPLTKYGFLGVQLFFVISGFVIAWSAEGRGGRDFIIARAARIYPGFLLCMTLTFAVTLALGAPRFGTSITQWVANLVIVAPALKQPFMDGVYWSIVYELVFYAWTALLIFTGLFPRRLTVIVVLWLAVSVANETLLGSGALRRLLITDGSGFFGAGLLLYALHSGRRDKFTWPLLFVATGVGVFQAEIDSQWVRDHFGIALSDIVIAGICVGAVALVGLGLLWRRVPLPAKLIAALGGLTYPLYLIHQQVGFIIFNRLEGRAAPAVLVGATIAAMLLLSWAIWRFAERRGQRALKSALNRILVWPLRRPAVRATADPAATPARAMAGQAPVQIFGPIAIARAARS